MLRVYKSFKALRKRNSKNNTTSEGISLLGLSKAAETFGMHSFCVKTR